MKIRSGWFVFVLFTLLSGCGGGGGGGGGDSGDTIDPPVTPPPTGGIGRTGVAIGPIATFGSIVVNGVRYDTSEASFLVNGEAGRQSDLRVGDVVVVEGTLDDDGVNGTADTVTFEEAVKGPVQEVDLGLGRLVVLGQTVFVTPDTSFDDSFSPPSLEGVSENQIVEVSGQFDANGDVVATRIEPKPAGTAFEVHGTVTALDTANARFNLSGLVVDYSAATLDNFESGQIREGDPVEAKATALGAAGELLATSVEFEARVPDVSEDDFAEIQGFIDRFADAGDFSVAGFDVATTAQTVFEGGSAADLGLNVKVEVEGTFDSSSTLVASKVDIRRAKAVRITASLDSVDAASDSVAVLGITVAIDALTRLEDKSDARVEPLTVAALNAGDYVEVRGDEFPAGSGRILATIFERDDPDNEAILQGFVENIGNPTLSILGVSIETSGATVFRDENDVVISGADFFARLAEGDLVKAKGSEVTDTTIVAEEVEFELEF
jgi:hypothetical protein